MFDPHPDGNWFEFAGDSLLHQHGKHVAGRMPGRKDHPIRLQGFTTRGFDPAHRAIRDDQLGHARIKPELPALRANPFPNRGDDRRQFVRANMRMRIHQNLPRRAEADQRAQHRTDIAAFFRTRVQLAVGIRARPALAKTVVRILIHHMHGVDGLQILDPLTHILAPLEHDRHEPTLQTSQRGEQTRRP